MVAARGEEGVAAGDGEVEEGGSGVGLGRMGRVRRGSSLRTAPSGSTITSRLSVLDILGM